MPEAVECDVLFILFYFFLSSHIDSDPDIPWTPSVAVEGNTTEDGRKAFITFKGTILEEKKATM